MIRLALLSASIFAAASAKAVIVSNFDNFTTQLLPPMFVSWTTPGNVDQYVQGSGYISIAPVGSGNPKGDGYFLASLPGNATVDFTQLTLATINARVDAGNASSFFNVILLDGTLTQAGKYTFDASNFTSSFSEQSAPLIVSGGGNLANVSFWRIEGDGLASNDFRFSFESLAAVPEPATTLLAGLAFLWLGIRRLRTCNSRGK